MKLTDVEDLSRANKVPESSKGTGRRALACQLQESYLCGEKSSRRSIRQGQAVHIEPFASLIDRNEPQPTSL